MEPDVLKTISGMDITCIQDWEMFRRDEILQLFSTYVYGIRSIEHPNKLNFIVESVDENFLDGKAVYKKIKVNFQGQSGDFSFPIMVFIPKGINKPAPAFVYVMHEEQSAKYDLEKDPNARVVPVEMIINRGYALLVYETKFVTPNNEDYLNQGILSVLEPDGTGRTDASWAIISAWAWAASRVMDYIETDQEIDKNRVAIVGHSRGGKTALWAGATDKRFALVVSNNSGCTGAAYTRGKKGETVKIINTNFPYWFCKNYRKFNDNEEMLPVDQHMLLALIAPRALYVTSSFEDEWADPASEFKACRLATPVYELYGEKGLILEGEPVVGQAYHKGKIAYHVKEGGHRINEFDWNCFIDFADQKF